MKKLLYLLLIPVLFMTTGCVEDVNVDIPEDVDVANITGLTVYSEQLAVLAQRTVIDVEAKTVVVTFTAVQSLSKLKVTLTVSAGSTVTSPLGVSFLDFSQPKTTTIVSPSGKVTSTWTISLVNP